MKTIPFLRLFIGTMGFAAFVGFPQAEAATTLIGDHTVTPSGGDPGNLTVHGPSFTLGGQWAYGFGQLVIHNDNVGSTGTTVSFMLTDNYYSQNWAWGSDYYSDPQMHLSSDNVLSLYEAYGASSTPSIQLFPANYYDPGRITIDGNDVLTTGSGALITSVNQGLVVGGTHSGSTVPASGAGTRMMWYPGKSSFRAGYVSGSQWDETNIGVYSAALNFNTKASGAASFATGNLTTASGSNSSAFGYSTIASGLHTSALGLGTVANSIASTAVGQYNLNPGHADDIFMVGNGTGLAVRSNVLTVRKSGSLSAGTGTVIGNVTAGSGQVVVGAYNDTTTDTSSEPDTIRGEGVFIVGAGTSSVRKNALRVTTSGKVLVQPSGELGMGTFTSGEKP
ncbi:MAG: hypothetical protein EOP84_08365, partial [Verrucomicrobiaceae bacterium]